MEKEANGKPIFFWASSPATHPNISRWVAGDEAQKKIGFPLAIYGDPNFAFTAGNVRFICLNTNAMEYDYSEPVPDFNFIENELNNLRYRDW